MGSTSGLPVMEKAAKFLDEMAIPSEMNALSAHRTPAEVEEFATGAKARGEKVTEEGGSAFRDYLLPEAVEQRTPIGVKLVFGRWLNEQGEAFWQIHLVYQSTRQLREMTPLTLENPPMVYPLRFADVPLNADGMATEEDVLAMLDRALEAYEELQEKYGEEEELDQAA